MHSCFTFELKRYPLLRVSFCLLIFSGSHCYADTLNVAVASNFAGTLKLLSADFEQLSEHALRVSSASTGKIYAQIQHGAPFDVFLSADESHAERLVSEKKAVPSSAYVYAVGRLVLWSNLPADNCRDLLFSGRIKRLSMANPAIAPYGLAARQVLDKLSLWSTFKPHIVMGENVAQAFQFVYTKNAEAGFVARSMLRAQEDGCVWEVPAGLHSPVRQKMVVMNKAKDKSSAQAFQQYMRSARAREIIKSSGYDVTP